MIIHGISQKYFKAIDYFGDKLKLPKDIILEFSYSRKIPMLGHCWESDESIFSRVPIYCVQLKTGQDNQSLLETIAHEMCHIKQYVNHEITASLNTWRGIYVKDEPWEIEAEDFAINVYSELNNIRVKNEKKE
tara:strand:+ start:582 stop:980 length:399 start_codon:yes stop_codon:yes gene_type:complete